MANPTTHAFTAAQIRAAEQPLLDAQQHPDELMQQAAHSVAVVARHMVPAGRVLLLVGTGGNGGDALYAGAELSMEGYRVEAWCVFGTAHNRALEVFSTAGGRVITTLDGPYDLVIDGVLGIGGAGDLPAGIRGATRGATVLAVDVPSGVSADSGARGANHLIADVSVTFGGWRLAHGLAPECGVQLLADIGLRGRTLGDQLAAQAGTPIHRASGPQSQWPEQLIQLGAGTITSDEPGFYDDKYTGGVVGIRAGSDTYPGAAILSTAGAVAATSAMVRYAGPQVLEVVRAHPEVVATDTLDAAGRVQAWVFGPGVGTDDQAAAELAAVLNQEVPVLIDADGLSLLANSADLRDKVAHRSCPTVVTPHDGEFHRLADAVCLPKSDRLTETRALATALDCVVVRKGRSTVIARPDGGVRLVDAGCSWAATPGSGDVLSGIIGARMARDGVDRIHESVIIHARAALLAAQTPFGEAQTSASGIAEHVRAATAQLR